MKELIKITTNKNNEQLVGARDLHKFLELTERYSVWFERMLQYGFVEGVDFIGCKVFNALAKQDLQDHIMKISMAKEISMIQRNEKGKQARQYFIECEKQLRQVVQKQLPQDYLSALKALVAVEEEKLLLEEKNIELVKEVTHKEDVIVGLVEDISLSTKRQRITQIIRHTKKGNYQSRYLLLYTEFEKKYHLDINRRIIGLKKDAYKPKIKNKMDYIDRVMHMIPQLYEVACKIFENDVEQLKKEWDYTI